MQNTCEQCYYESAAGALNAAAVYNNNSGSINNNINNNNSNNNRITSLAIVNHKTNSSAAAFKYLQHRILTILNCRKRKTTTIDIIQQQQRLQRAHQEQKQEQQQRDQDEQSIEKFGAEAKFKIKFLKTEGLTFALLAGPMGQAASMCRFRGCRYKKSKSNKATTASATSTPTPTPTTSNIDNNSVGREETVAGPEIATTAAPATNSTPSSIAVAEDPTSGAASTMPTAGLHLRSIEEPPTLIQTSSGGHRMPVIEQGGTVTIAYPGDLTRTGAPLQQLHQYPHHHHHHHHYNQHSSSHHSHIGSGPPHSPLSPHKSYDAEYARMESWMDENQEFVQDYFIRKATRQTVDTWLVSHATSAGNDVVVAGSPTHANAQNCSSSRGGSGATTPVRKISAHEFERGGLLKPIVNTIDGTPTFLSIGTQLDCSANNSSGSGIIGSFGGGGGGGGGISGSGSFTGGGGFGLGTGPPNGIGGGGVSSIVSGNGHHPHHYYNHCNSYQCSGGFGVGNAIGHHCHRPQRLSRNELKQLDEKELIFELVKDICNELEVRSLCHKILQNVSILLNADRGSLFLVQGRCNGADGPKKCLVSKLFDVCPRSTVEEMEQQEEVRVAWGTGIAGHVAESGEPVNIPDAYQDERFNCEIDTLTGYRTKALLCMPIKDSSGDVIGVAQVINKLNGECFTETDEKVFASYLQFCGIGLRNAQLYEKSQLEIKRNQVLLDLARMIFEEQSTIEHMVFRILTHMQSLIQCQRVQILLVHEASKGSFSRVFDFEANDLSEEDNTLRTSPYESRFPINVGITGHVATTGETVNIPNAYEDDRFDPSVDDGLTFKHKSILCMAIKNSLGQIIGVIQLINKFDDLIFTKNDENFVEAFAIFCGMGIHNTHMYEKAIVAMAKQSVTLEVLSYHASATIDEAHRLRRLRVPSAAHFRLHDFRFDDILFDDDDTLKACLRMFLDLDFVERFHIDYEVLCRWLLSVKKNYRNVTYHNWRHAFNVAQMMFAILTSTQWWKIFGEIECLALIIGCLCHDLDHRGTNNSFQIKASSPLAQLYSTSTMEHHHFDQCLMILNSPGNQILANLSSEDYCRVIRVLEDAILSTDLAVYFRKRGPFLQSVQEQPMSYWFAEEPRSLLRAMSMTVCDLSAITKPWDIEKRVADLVSSEFFEQGDVEKQELNITPIDIMNREKEDELPMMQVGFIESICLPIYEAFAKLSDKLEPLVEGVRDNRQHWLELAQKVQDKSSLSIGDSSTTTVATTTTAIVEVNGNSSSGAVINNINNNNNNNSNSMNDLSRDASIEEAGTTTTCESNAEADCDADISTANDDDGDDNADADADGDNDDICLGAMIEEAEEEDLDRDDGEEDGIEADDDDSEVEIHHSATTSTTTCHSHSSASSRLSTPPPTGEDDSTPTSPAKSSQAKLIAANLNNLTNHKAAKCRSSCRSCEYTRLSNIRKTSSLKGANELAAAHKLSQNGGSGGVVAGCRGCSSNHSKSAPAMTNCGSGATVAHNISSSQQHIHQHHGHSHSHGHGHHHQNHHHQQQQQQQQQQHHHHHNHGHHHHHHHNSSNTSSAAESDKIPKIVGKLGNLDSMQYYTSASACSDPCNGGIGFTPNGHFNYLPGNLLARRHSETNGPTASTATPMAAAMVAAPAPLAIPGVIGASLGGGVVSGTTPPGSGLSALAAMTAATATTVKACDK